MLIGILCRIVLLFYGIIFRKSNKDYSFDSKDTKLCKQYLENGQYREFEKLFLQLDSDTFTQVSDCIGLSTSENKLIRYYDESEDKNIANLLLGIFYNHQAWLIRSHNLAKNISTNQALGFFEYQEKSGEKLLAVTEQQSIVFTEALSRLIRHSMGEGNLEMVEYYFLQVMKRDPEHLWAHLGYCEAVQPKWGGNLKFVSNLMSEIKSKRKIISQSVELKLILDSFILGENYFGSTMKELKKLAKRRLIEIDKSISSQKELSIQKYVLYCYLFALGEVLANPIITVKNCFKMKGFHTLYPFGVNR